MGRGGLGHEVVEAREGPAVAGGGVLVHVACGCDAGEDKASTAKRDREIGEVGASRAVGGHGMGWKAARCCQEERVAVEEAEAEVVASIWGTLSFGDGGGDLCVMLVAGCVRM